VLGLKKVVAYAAELKEKVIKDLGEALTTISLWFQSSGLKANAEKTEIAIFYKPRRCTNKRNDC
jgi:hypothetical protein